MTKIPSYSGFKIYGSVCLYKDRVWDKVQRSDESSSLFLRCDTSTISKFSVCSNSMHTQWSLRVLLKNGVQKRKDFPEIRLELRGRIKYKGLLFTLFYYNSLYCKLKELKKKGVKIRKKNSFLNKRLMNILVGLKTFSPFLLLGTTPLINLWTQ